MSSKLHAAQAAKMAAAEARYNECKRETAKAKEDRDELRVRYRDRLPLGEWVTAGKWHFKRVEKSTGQRFKLAAFLERNRLSGAMKPFVSAASTYEDLQIKPRS